MIEVIAAVWTPQRPPPHWIVNAGDGTNEHPTQTLIDLLVMRRHGLSARSRLVVMGNLRDHRTSHSLVLALHELGVKVTSVSPEDLSLPRGLDAGIHRVIHTEDAAAVDAALADADFVYQVPLKFWTTPSREAGPAFTLNRERLLRTLRPGAKLLHPFPRHEELDRDVDGSSFNAYLEQTAAGAEVRVRVLLWAAGVW